MPSPAARAYLVARGVARGVGCGKRRESQRLAGSWRVIKMARLSQPAVAVGEPVSCPLPVEDYSTGPGSSDSGQCYFTAVAQRGLRSRGEPTAGDGREMSAAAVKKVIFGLTGQWPLSWEVVMIQCTRFTADDILLGN